MENLATPRNCAAFAAAADSRHRCSSSASRGRARRAGGDAGDAELNAALKMADTVGDMRAIRDRRDRAGRRSSGNRRPRIPQMNARS